MTAPNAEPRRRQWADLATIIVGVSLLGLAMWGGPILTLGDDEVAYPRALWLVFAGAGALSLGGVLAAQRASLRGLGRVLVVVAAILLLGSLVAFSGLDWAAVVAAILPATVLAVAASFMGPIPPPS